MRRRLGLPFAFLAVLCLAVAPAASKSAVAAKGDLKWVDLGIPGVAAATVDGDMKTGASHFYLKYPAGLVTPLHHHSPDHYVSVLSGNLVLVVDGKDYPVPPGSFFALTGKQAHAARCEGKEDCVMFIDARGAWDVVPEKK